MVLLFRSDALVCATDLSDEVLCDVVLPEELFLETERSCALLSDFATGADASVLNWTSTAGSIEEAATVEDCVKARFAGSGKDSES